MGLKKLKDLTERAASLMVDRLEEAKGSGGWVTIRGNHVLLGSKGEIKVGPEALVKKFGGSTEAKGRANKRAETRLAKKLGSTESIVQRRGEHELLKGVVSGVTIKMKGTRGERKLGGDRKLGRTRKTDTYLNYWDMIRQSREEGLSWRDIDAGKSMYDEDLDTSAAKRRVFKLAMLDYKKQYR